MIKNIITSALAGLALAVPGQARIESGTKPLIELIDSSGIAVLVDTEEASGEYLGLYRMPVYDAPLSSAQMAVDATDHMVVRHEAIPQFNTASMVVVPTSLLL